MRKQTRAELEQGYEHATSRASLLHVALNAIAGGETPDGTATVEHDGWRHVLTSYRASSPSGGFIVTTSATCGQRPWTDVLPAEEHLRALARGQYAAIFAHAVEVLTLARYKTVEADAVARRRA